MFGHRELYRECTTPVPVSLRLVEHCLDAEITQTENIWKFATKFSTL